MAKEDLEKINSDLGDAETHQDEADNSLRRAGDRAKRVNDNDGFLRVERVRKQGNEYKESIKELKKDFGNKGR